MRHNTGESKQSEEWLFRPLDMSIKRQRYPISGGSLESYDITIDDLFIDSYSSDIQTHNTISSSLGWYSFY